jgi:hypothetical protein
MEVMGQLHALAILPPGEEYHLSTHWIEGWMSPRIEVMSFYLALHKQE